MKPTSLSPTNIFLVIAIVLLPCGALALTVEEYYALPTQESRADALLDILLAKRHALNTDPVKVRFLDDDFIGLSTAYSPGRVLLKDLIERAKQTGRTQLTVESLLDVAFDKRWDDTHDESPAKQ
jgi:hypothetical protein